MGAGVLSQISFGLETTWGTPVVPNKSLAVRPGDGIQTNTDLKFISAIKAQLAKNVSSFKGAQKHEGDYEVDFIPGIAAYLLKSAFGAVSSVAKTTPNTTVYDHTFTEQESKPSLTVEQAVGDIVRRYAGCLVHSLAFSCAAGDALTLKAGVRGKSSSTATKISPAYETVRPFTFADIGSTGFTVGGQALTQVQSFDLTYENNTDVLHTLGNNDPAYNVTKASEVSGKFELYLDATTAAEYTDYLNNTNNALLITFTGDPIGSSSNYGLQLNVPRVAYKAATYPITEDQNILSVDFEGLYDTVTSKLISAILTNLTAAIT